MVSFRAYALGLVALATTSLAAPAAKSLTERTFGCMTPQQAQTIATDFGTLISVYNKALAQRILASDYTDYSESVNALIDSCPTGQLSIRTG